MRVLVLTARAACSRAVRWTSSASLLWSTWSRPRTRTTRTRWRVRSACSRGCRSRRRRTRRGLAGQSRSLTSGSRTAVGGRAAAARQAARQASRQAARRQPEAAAGTFPPPRRPALSTRATGWPHLPRRRVTCGSVWPLNGVGGLAVDFIVLGLQVAGRPTPRRPAARARALLVA